MLPITQDGRGRVVDAEVMHSTPEDCECTNRCGWGTALTIIVAVLLGLLVVAYFAFQNIIFAS